LWLPSILGGEKPRQFLVLEANEAKIDIFLLQRSQFRR
jgi:hypothetical protein